MKKVVKLFLLVITCLFIFSLTSCAVGTHADAPKVKPNFEVVENQTIAKPHVHIFDANHLCECGIKENPSKPEEVNNYKFLGYYTFDPATKTAKLYLEGSVIPVKDSENQELEYEVVYEVVENGVVLVPEYGHQRDGFYFAGWYQNENFEFGQRVTTLESVDKFVKDSSGNPLSAEALAKVDKSLKDKIVCGKYIEIGDAGIIVLVCVTIVFLMLILLSVIVKAFKFIPNKKETKQEPVSKPQPVVSAPQKAFTMEDIKDEDMMVAALVATIDYHNETNEDVRVVSVKQIG